MLSTPGSRHMVEPPNLEIHSNSTEDRTQWAYGWAGHEDRDVLDMDASFTMHQANCRPALLAIERAEGVYVFDGQGRRYIDLHGNNCHHIGYRHPSLVAAMTDQLGKLSHNNRGFTNSVFSTLARTLAGLWPGNNGRMFMVPGGAAAKRTGAGDCPRSYRPVQIHHLRRQLSRSKLRRRQPDRRNGTPFSAIGPVAAGCLLCTVVQARVSSKRRYRRSRAGLL